MSTEPCGQCTCGMASAQPAPAAASRTVDRRAFLTHSASAAVAVALAACGLSTNTPTSPGNLSTKLTVNVSDYPALANVDGVAYVSDGGDPLAVVRTGSSTFVALSRICPHAGNIIQAVSGGFYCPGHGAEFSYTGQWIGGQPTNSMTSFPVVYDATAETLTIG